MVLLLLLLNVFQSKLVEIGFDVTTQIRVSQYKYFYCSKQKTQTSTDANLI